MAERNIGTSLDYMSVPGRDSAGVSLMMPKLKYRFVVTFDDTIMQNGNSFRLASSVVDVTRPKSNAENVVIDVFNSKINVAGKVTWDPITITLRDDMSGNTQTAISKQLAKQYDYQNQQSARAASDYKFTMSIDLIDGQNTITPEYEKSIVERWLLKGCYIQSFDNGNQSYNSSEVSTIQLTIQYDVAVIDNRITGNGASAKIFGQKVLDDSITGPRTKYKSLATGIGGSSRNATP